MFHVADIKYEKALRWSLTHRKTIVFGAIAIFVISFFLMGMLGSQFFPDSDRSEFNIVVNASPGSSLEQTSLICEKVETIVKAIPEVKLMFTTIGSGNNPVTNATILVKLIPTNERKKSDKKMKNRLIILVKIA